jgi:hypothetical protein
VTDDGFFDYQTLAANAEAHLCRIVAIALPLPRVALQSILLQGTSLNMLLFVRATGSEPLKLAPQGKQSHRGLVPWAERMIVLAGHEARVLEHPFDLRPLPLECGKAV